MGINGIETKVDFNGKVYSLCIGYETKWFGQVPLIMLVEEEYDDNRKVVFASVLWESRG